SSFLPVLARGHAGPAVSEPPPIQPGPPELEFILRTIFDLKLDVEDLRREMENFRHRAAREMEVPYPARFATLGPAAEERNGAKPEPEDADVVVFRPGMTMQDIEREAIRAALNQVGGNRRRAA